jgi:uncharacterized alkaline shock family protein YloU
MNEFIEYPAGELGQVEISPEVIQIISGISATKVEGVHGLAGGVVSDFNEWMGRKNLRKGIRVELDERTMIELAIIVNYGVYVPDVGRKVQDQVKSTVESMTGITVDRVIVRVEGIKFPQAEKSADADGTHRVR